jgi:hypothetical protein
MVKQSSGPPKGKTTLAGASISSQQRSMQGHGQFWNPWLSHPSLDQLGYELQ